MVACSMQMLDGLGLAENTTLELNTLGNAASRAAYRERLVAYLQDHAAALSEDSRARLTRNPLRILDSKDKGDRAIIVDAPDFSDSLDEESRDFFDEVCAGLAALDIGYSLNTRLVRGLDYYCHTAFEFTTDALGAQGTVLAGGRYDGLVSQMGGTETAGVGWAAGIERIAMLAGGGDARPRPIAVIPVNRDMEMEALKLAHRLRADGLAIELAYKGNLSRRMKRANRLNARAAIILGPDEAAKGAATFRDLDSGGQEEVSLATLSQHLAPYR